MNATRFVHPSLQLDMELDHLERERSVLRSMPSSPRRSERMAETYRREAEIWSFVFSHTSIRIYWRAALFAEVEARRAHRYWLWRAVEETATWPTAVVLPAADSARSELTGGAA